MNPTSFSRVFLNMLMNAQQAISENGSDGTITIETSKAPASGAENGNGFVKSGFK